MSAISASPVEPAILPFGSLEWFKRQLASTPDRARRTAIMVGAAVLCVIISMTLQVPELSVTAYMPFFVSQETKLKTTVVGVGGLIGLTIGIGITLLLYKFTYGSSRTAHPRDGDRALSWDVAVARFCDRAARIPHRFYCRCLAVRRRSSPLT